MNYKEFEIEIDSDRKFWGRPDYFTFVHPNYDGPESNLAGTAESIKECKEKIDCLILGVSYEN